MIKLKRTRESLHEPVEIPKTQNIIKRLCILACLVLQISIITMTVVFKLRLVKPVRIDKTRSS